MLKPEDLILRMCKPDKIGSKVTRNFAFHTGVHLFVSKLGNFSY